MDYRALFGAGGARLAETAEKRMQARTSNELDCTMYSTIRNRFKRYLAISKSDIEEILRKKLPVKASVPRLDHLLDKTLVPLFVGSFNKACVAIIKQMEKNVRSTNNQNNNSLAHKISKIIHENESQVIKCLYTTQAELTEVF